MWKQKILSNYPHTWSSLSYDEDNKLVPVTRGTSEYNNIKHLIGSSFDVKKILRVENAYLYARYNLKLQECKSRSGSVVGEQQLIHCTSFSNAELIAASNFDWRRANRCRFGQGVSFSPSAEYADTYSGNKGAFIIAKVIIGHSCGGSYSTILPAIEGYDTTSGNNSKVYVKYYDDEFYPEYIACYEDTLGIIGGRFRRMRF